jgi:serine/threonine-protein kinase
VLSVRDHVLATGSLLGGRYRLTRVLGEGGMGVVWAAVNEGFGREVAIKVLLPDIAAKEAQAVERFFNEARICGALRHPGIVDVLDVGRAEDGSPYLVMELLEGAPLDAVLQRAGQLRPLDILPIVRDVARTLSLAHARGVVHRDLKPANLFLHQIATGQVMAKVLDFGISKVIASKEAVVKTRTGTIMGSPAYLSPEQALANVELDARSDVHSLGVILYEALSGRLPFTGDTYNALVIQIATQDPPPLGSIVPGLPKPVLEIVKGAMERDREARIPSAAALADRIEAALVAMGASASLPVPSPAALTGGPRGDARQTSVRDEDERHVGFARTQAVTEGRSGWRAGRIALAAGGVAAGGVAAMLVLRWLSAGTGTIEPGRAGDTASATASITVAPATSAAPVVTVAPAATSAAPVTTGAAPAGGASAGGASARGASAGGASAASSTGGSAAPAKTAVPAKKKKKDLFGYD